MAAKKHDIDVSQTVELIRDYWPHFPITKENFEKPTSDFVVSFYKQVVVELNEKLSFITNEEVNGGEYMDNQEMNEEIYLYCQMAKIYKKLNYNAFSLTDIYDPHPKRMHALMKTAIHFLIFVNNDFDNITNVSNAIYKKFTDTRDLQSLKQQTLQDTAENSENLARSRDINLELRTKVETIKGTKYEKMLRDKAEKERVYSEKLTEKKRLESEVDSLEYELCHLEEKESDLLQRVVTEEDFQDLKKREKFFELEYKRISSDNCDVDDDFTKESEMGEYLGECAKGLETLGFDSIDVYTLREMREKRKLCESIQQKYKKEKSMLDATAAAKIDTLNKKNQREEEHRTLYSQLQAKAAEDSKKENRFYKEKTAQFAARFQQFQKLQTETCRHREDIAKLEQDRCKFEQKAEGFCQEMLAADENTSAKFNNTLLHLKNLK